VQKSDEIRRDILQLLQNNGHRSFRPKEIARKLGLSEQSRYRASRKIMEELAESGLIEKVKGGRFSFRPARPLLEGVLSVHRDGYGFVSVEGEARDYFVRSRRMKNALDGDRVEIGRAAPRRGDSRREAEIVRVLERGRKTIVGTFRDFDDFRVVVPDDPRIQHEIYVSKERSGGASDGYKVVASIDQFEDHRGAPHGSVLEVLGPGDDASVQTLSVAIGAGVRTSFPDAVLKETNGATSTIPKSELKRREDLRSYVIFTIDPNDARDFDDAIHIRELGNGRLELGVHIADVSHYVVPGSATDIEALERGTSVYLVDRVIPMLPENLSNQVCSLRPDEDRLAFSCIMELTRDGTITGHRVAETVIRSKRRLTYDEAQTIIEAGESGEDPLSGDLSILADLTKNLIEVRRKKGSIDFDLPEIKVVLDAEGSVEQIIPRVRLLAHRLVEECMLAANRTVAERMAALKDTPFVYRIHDHPDRERIKQLSTYVRAFGLQLPHEEGRVEPRDLNALLTAVKGTPREPIIEEAALRAMAKARYSPDNIGHYGLALSYYTHFTSPIRRYPDLLVHRLIKRQLEGAGPKEKFDRLKSICDLTSERERVGVEAERASVRMKQVTYAVRHVGESFSGVIRGVTRFGIYVLLTELLVEGMVHVRDMKDDYYEFDERAFALRGDRSRKMYRPGDAVRVILAAARTETSEIDLVFPPSSERNERRNRRKRR
jgi:ribonuclease R